MGTEISSRCLGYRSQKENKNAWDHWREFRVLKYIYLALEGKIVGAKCEFVVMEVSM